MRVVTTRFARYASGNPALSSGDAGGFSAGSAPGSRGDFDPIASCGFRAVEGFIGCLEDFFGRRIFSPRSCNTKTCSHREFGWRGYARKLPDRVAGLTTTARALVAAVGTARVLAAIWATQAKLAGFDGGAQILQMI
jgi:hypothetical protein